ncbi:MAG TPA: hypothetical protein PKE42_05395 [Arachnia sp.]|nr:hypothetical protein [Arachnia sp.]
MDHFEAAAEEPRGLGQAPESVIQGDLCVFVGSKPVRFSHRDSCLSVKTFGGSRGELPACEEPVLELPLMVAEGSRELLEGRDAGPDGAARPVGEEARGGGDGAIAPEALEVLLQEVGAHGLQIDGDEVAQASALAAPEVLRSLEEEPPGLREVGLLSGRAQGADLVATYEVDGLAHELHDVEAVEHVQGVPAAGTDYLEECLPHVAGD